MDAGSIVATATSTGFAVASTGVAVGEDVGVVEVLLAIVGDGVPSIAVVVLTVGIELRSGSEAGEEVQAAIKSMPSRQSSIFRYTI